MSDPQTTISLSSNMAPERSYAQVTAQLTVGPTPTAMIATVNPNAPSNPPTKQYRTYVPMAPVVAAAFVHSSNEIRTISATSQILMIELANLLGPTLKRSRDDDVSPEIRAEVDAVVSRMRYLGEWMVETDKVFCGLMARVSKGLQPHWDWAKPHYLGVHKELKGLVLKTRELRYLMPGDPGQAAAAREEQQQRQQQQQRQTIRTTGRMPARGEAIARAHRRTAPAL